MRLPSIRKEPEPEEPVIHVTATGEQRAPARGRGRKADPEKVVESFKKPITIGNVYVTSKKQPPSSREMDAPPLPLENDKNLDYLERQVRWEGRKDADQSDPPDRDWLKLITGVVFGILAVGLIALGAILFSLPTSPANIAWIHAETAGLAIMLVLLYIKK